MKHISILGSTGSIGTQTLCIVKQHPTLFKLIGLVAGNNIELLKKQIKEFLPEKVSITSKENFIKLSEWVKNEGISTQVFFGNKGIEEIISTKQDLIVIAIVGTAGIKPTYLAISKKIDIALACKEALVSAGDIIIKKAKENNVKIFPVDSEHAAIKQCINAEKITDIHKITLTASGGPFWKEKLQNFKQITPKKALAHPNWEMGGKISIDSATMVNKGLEIIEAHHLFNIDYNKIDVAIHTQSIVHSFVEFNDGNVIAHLSPTNMMFPIQYALTYPKKYPTKQTRLKLQELSKLTFEPPNHSKFPLLQLAIECGKKKQTYPIIFNAANEVFVNLFLQEKIHYLDIQKHIVTTLETYNHKEVTSIDEIIDIDREIKHELLQNFK